MKLTGISKNGTQLNGFNLNALSYFSMGSAQIGTTFTY